MIGKSGNGAIGCTDLGYLGTKNHFEKKHLTRMFVESCEALQVTCDIFTHSGGETLLLFFGSFHIKHQQNPWVFFHANTHGTSVPDSGDINAVCAVPWAFGIPRGEMAWAGLVAWGFSQVAIVFC